MSLRDKKGNKIFRKIEVKIYFPGNVLPMKRLTQTADPHMGFGPDGVDDVLMQLADQLDTAYPWWDFIMVPLASPGRVAQFIFKFKQYRAGFLKSEATTVASPDELKLARPHTTPDEEGSTPEPGTTEAQSSAPAISAETEFPLQ